MKTKNDLPKELNFKAPNGVSCGSLDVDVSEVKHKVIAKLDSASSERNRKTMKSKKKVIFTAIAAAIVLAATAFAANGTVGRWFSTSSSDADYKTLPSVQQVEADIGYAPVIVEKFENGYAFECGRVINNRLADENGNAMESFKSVSFEYKKGGEHVVFTQEKFETETDIAGDVIASVNGVDVYYFAYTNKLVPPNYKLSADEQRAADNGEIVFGYGASEVSTTRVQSVTWYKDGVRFELLQIGATLPSDELCTMAQEVIVRA